MDFQCLELWATLICNRKVKLSNGSDLKSNISLHSIISTNSLLSCLIEINKKCFIFLMSLENEIKEKLDKGLPDYNNTISSTWVKSF